MQLAETAAIAQIFHLQGAIHGDSRTAVMTTFQQFGAVFDFKSCPRRHGDIPCTIRAGHSIKHHRTAVDCQVAAAADAAGAGNRGIAVKGDVAHRNGAVYGDVFGYRLVTARGR